MVVRASQKTINGVAVKTGYVLPSPPWLITGSFYLLISNWKKLTGGEIGITDNNQWPLLFGLPLTATDGTAIALKRLIVDVSSNGVAGNSLLMDTSLATLPVLPTGRSITPANSVALRNNPTKQDTLAELRYGSTAIKGATLNSFPHEALGANDISPFITPEIAYSRDKWMDTPVLMPGEYIGAKYQVDTTNQQPNGNERLYLLLAWDEVVL